MSVYLYDNAILDKLKSWTRDTSVHIYGTEETSRLFEVTADMHQDKPIELPLIALSRESSYSIENTVKKPLVYDGMTLDATIEKSIQLNAIPIELSYQVDIYTRYQKEADDYVRDLIFNFITFPQISICIPYLQRNYIHNSTIKLDQSVMNNSNVQERLVPGEFTRYTLKLNVVDAYLWDIHSRDNRMIFNPDNLLVVD